MVMNIKAFFRSLYKKLVWIPIVTIANIVIIISTIHALTNHDNTEEISELLSEMGRNTAFLSKESVPSIASNDTFLIEIDKLQDDILLIRSRLTSIDLNPDEDCDAKRGADLCAIEVFKFAQTIESMKKFVLNFEEMKKHAKEKSLTSIDLLYDSDWKIFLRIMEKANFKSYMEKANINMTDKEKRKLLKSILSDDSVKEILEYTDFMTLRCFKQLNLLKNEYVLKLDGNNPS